ncbi:hypothetical protein EZV62_024280 [Acer yangbiense]|uniref:Uncharacterized protein n=1 Tax=Acer yangbiense TaxID=1000413 RepID=A0A5C7H6A2_9ROSI|nr:hypothetical protein EZV62_024280 [Acer yangbiense]
MCTPRQKSANAKAEMCTPRPKSAHAKAKMCTRLAHAKAPTRAACPRQGTMNKVINFHTKFEKIPSNFFFFFFPRPTLHGQGHNQPTARAKRCTAKAKISPRLVLHLELLWFSWYTRELEHLEFNNLNLYILKSGIVDYKATLPLTIPRRVFKSSAKDSTRRSVGITFQGGPCGSSAARASPTARASGDREVPTAGRQTGGGRTRRSSPDSDLEAFSHNPAHGSFAPLAFQPSAMTNCANQRFLSY